MTPPHPFLQRPPNFRAENGTSHLYPPQASELLHSFPQESRAQMTSVDAGQIMTRPVIDPVCSLIGDFARQYSQPTRCRADHCTRHGSSCSSSKGAHQVSSLSFRVGPIPLTPVPTFLRTENICIVCSKSRNTLALSHMQHTTTPHPPLHPYRVDSS